MIVERDQTTTQKQAKRILMWMTGTPMTGVRRQREDLVQSVLAAAIGVREAHGGGYADCDCVDCEALDEALSALKS